MPLKKSVRVTKRGVKSRTAKKTRKQSRAKKLQRKKKSRSKKQSHSLLESQLRNKKTWLFIAFAFSVAFLLQQFQVVSLVVQEDVLPQCTTHEHCPIGKNCIFDRCYAHTPSYPEIGKIKVVTGYGKEVIPNARGYFEVEPDELMYLDVQADNQDEPFQIHVYSQVGFGTRGLEKNRNMYFSPLQEGDLEFKNLYWIKVNKEEKDHYHRFYFELLGFKGEKYNMFVFLKNGSEYQQSSSEIVEVPIELV